MKIAATWHETTANLLPCEFMKNVQTLFFALRSPKKGNHRRIQNIRNMISKFGKVVLKFGPECSFVKTTRIAREVVQGKYHHLSISENVTPSWHAVLWLARAASPIVQPPETRANVLIWRKSLCTSLGSTCVVAVFCRKHERAHVLNASHLQTRAHAHSQTNSVCMWSCHSCATWPFKSSTCSSQQWMTRQQVFHLCQIPWIRFLDIFCFFVFVF